jgi:hypothetical protein
MTKKNLETVAVQGVQGLRNSKLQQAKTRLIIIGKDEVASSNLASSSRKVPKSPRFRDFF